MESKAQAILDFVVQDRLHGANSLAREMLLRIENWVHELDSLFLTELDELAQALTTCRPSMAPIGNCADRWHQQLQTLEPSVDVKAAVLEELGKVRTALLSANQSIAEHCRALISSEAGSNKEPLCIFTHSYSSAVETLMESLVASALPFRVVMTTSYPGFEGQNFAAKLNDLKIETTLIPDTQAAILLPECDYVILGADMLLEDRHVINKCGTYLIAAAAKELHKPLWFLADTFKHSHLKRPAITLEEMDVSELNAPSGDYIQVRNIYFEAVPSNLYTGWIDEQGVHQVQ